jgi:hypothetical protein
VGDALMTTRIAAVALAAFVVYVVWTISLSWRHDGHDCYAIDWTPWNAPASQGHCKW